MDAPAPRGVCWACRESGYTAPYEAAEARFAATERAKLAELGTRGEQRPPLPPLPPLYSTFIPFDGAVIHEVMVHPSGVFVLGQPHHAADGESADAHNCEAMGCGTQHVLPKHVLARLPYPGVAA